MAFSQIATSVTILNTGLIGYTGISITNFTTSAASLIASGSGIEIAGAFFKADTDITPNASSWTAISTASTAFLGLTPSGTAGSQIITAAWLSTAPVWSTSKQGWYATTASTTRVVLSAYKNGTSSYTNKSFLGNSQDNYYSYKMQGVLTSITSGSGNWTVPDGVYKLKVIVVGGGGGGGGSGGSDPGGGGGSGGGTVVNPLMATAISVIPGQVIAYSIGAGGSAGATAASGGDGANTTFGTLTGYAGKGGSAGLAGNGGAGGGHNDPWGSMGLPGQADVGGGGTYSVTPGGGLGNKGTGEAHYGAGGYGSIPFSVTGFKGGTGGSGIILIEY